MITSLVVAAAVMAAPLTDPEAAAEAAFANEAAQFGPLEHTACWVDPSGAPIYCYGFAADGSVVVGIAEPGLSFAFATYTASPPDSKGTPTATSAPAAQAFEDGLWLVGPDVQPGRYRSSGSDGCYWERLSGLDGEFDSIIANDFAVDSAQVLVEIQPSDLAFSSSGCGTWEMLP